LAIGLFGFGVALQFLMQKIAEIVVGVCIIGVTSEGFAIGLFGFGGAV